jgi:hypothetical protein
MKIELETIGVEFTFDLKEEDNTQRLRFYRGLYGWKSSSNYGQYLYIKEGLLSNINHIKPTKSTIIVSLENANILRKFFRKYDVVFNEKVIILGKKEAKILGLNIPNNWDRIYEDLKGNKNTILSVDF